MTRPKSSWELRAEKAEAELANCRTMRIALQASLAELRMLLASAEVWALSVRGLVPVAAWKAYRAVIPARYKEKA